MSMVVPMDFSVIDVKMELESLNCPHLSLIDDYFSHLDIASASGRIVSFMNDLVPLPFLELKANMEAHQDGTPWVGTEHNSVPYNFRAVKDANASRYGNTEYGNIVGGSVAWNQLIGASTSFRPSQTKTGITYTVNNDGTFTLDGTASQDDYWACVPYSNSPIIAGHKYYFCDANHNGSANTFGLGWRNGTILAYGNTGAIVSAESNSNTITYCYKNNVVIDNVIIKPMLFDLTQMFGSTIANYIYTLEQGTAGAGVAWFKKLFPKPYYPYNAGELISVKTTAHETIGFNQWDEEWDIGDIDGITGEFKTGNYLRSKNLIPVFPNTVYYFNIPDAIVLYEYDADKKGIVNNGQYTYHYINPNNTLLYTTDSRTRYIAFRNNVSNASQTYHNDICINLSDANLNGQYKPYTKHTYALDSDLELRGLFMLDANNNLYANGDIYPPSGNVARKFKQVTISGSVGISWSVLTTTSGLKYFYISKSNWNTLYGSMPVNVPLTKDTPAVADKLLVQPSAYANDITAEGIYGYPDNSVAFGFVLDSTKASTSSGFNTWLTSNPITMVYERQTATTETADPYTSAQAIDEYGTEAFVDGRTVEIPVGHNSYFGDVFEITGYDEVNVYVSPTEDEAEATVYTETFTDTVYGGTLNLLTGVLTLTWDIRDLGTLSTWTLNDADNHIFRASLSPAKPYGISALTPAICDIYSAVTRSSMNSNPTNGTFCIYKPSATNYIYVVDTRYSSKNDFVTGITGHYIAFELATPQTVQLTAQDIKMLVGENNIWSDVDEVEVIYYTKES